MVVDATDLFEKRAIEVAKEVYKKSGYFETSSRLPHLSKEQQHELNAKTLKSIYTKGT